LSALHEGGNQEFLDRVEVLEDARDKELVQIEAGRGYALLRAEREYQDEMRRAEEEYVVYNPLLPSSPPIPGVYGGMLICRHKNELRRIICCMN